MHRSMQEFFAGLCPVDELLYRNEPDLGLVKMLVPVESRRSGGEADTGLRSVPLPKELLSPAALAVARAWYTKAAAGASTPSTTWGSRRTIGPARLGQRPYMV